MKVNKKNVIIYIIVLFISLIMCYNYVKIHYANDTFAIYNMGYYEYGTKVFLKAGRPFSCLLLIFAGKFNLSIETFTEISTILGIFVSSLSVMLIRKIIYKFKLPKNNFEELIVLAISYCTIYNFMYIEILYFAEACVLAFGIFMAILSSYQLILSDKYRILKSFFLLLLAVFSYNGTVGVYIVSVVLISLLKNNNFIKVAKDILIALLFIIVTIFLNFIQIKYVSNYLNITQSRLSYNIINNIIYIISNIGNVLVGKITELFPKGLFLTFLFIILLISIFYFRKDRTQVLLKLMIFTIFGIFSSFAIHIFSLSSFAAGRLQVSLGMTIGYIFLMLYLSSEILNNKTTISNFMRILLFIYLIINIVNFYALTYNHQVGNQIDKSKVEYISNYIKEYEIKNNIEVKYVTMKYFPNTKNGYYKKINSINTFAIYSECSYNGIINFYTQNNYIRINLTPEIDNEYIKQTGGNAEYICIGDVLVCPVYNV